MKWWWRCGHCQPQQLVRVRSDVARCRWRRSRLASRLRRVPLGEQVQIRVPDIAHACREAEAEQAAEAEVSEAIRIAVVVNAESWQNGVLACPVEARGGRSTQSKSCFANRIDLTRLRGASPIRHSCFLSGMAIAGAGQISSATGRGRSEYTESGGAPRLLHVFG